MIPSSGTIPSNDEEAGRHKADLTDHPPRDDLDLIRGCLRGSSPAWEELIRRHQRLIYSIPFKCGLSSDDAADVFQTVCLRLLENLQTLRDERKLVAWIATTTTRECWRVKAGKDRIRVSLDDDELDLPQLAESAGISEDLLMHLQRQHIVRTGLERMPERCRKLLHFLFYEKDDWTYEAIAEEMSIPVSSIGPTRGRCLAKLKAELKRMGLD
ncbi:MAG: sigma-70 family RNA polymerase sigma factor [Acidobacteria bacterium]|nr:sigma-70 family RNA polymerase sigma factor [Acidobacteriota bacterium]